MLIWLFATLRRRAGRLAGQAAGIAIAVGLLACLGGFLTTAAGTMTARASGRVPVDWQVQVTGDPATAAATVAAEPAVGPVLAVGFARVPGLSTEAGGATHTTGAAVVVGVPAGYQAAFPTMVRPLTGDGAGVVLAQQTAANLHAAPGSVVTVGRPGLAPVQVTVAGIVDLPHADTLFAPVPTSAAAPSAPPDNVLLLPADVFHSLLDPLAQARPDLVGTQLHARRSHALPADPASAFVTAASASRHAEISLAGTGMVRDNLAAALDAARTDAAYATLLFLFLAVPGAVLAGLLTTVVVAAGATRRRREQALLRTRGATARRILAVTAVEAALVGTGGALVGLGAAVVVGRLAFGPPGPGLAGWLAAAALTGLVIAAGAVLIPAWRDLRTGTVTAARAALGRTRRPLWARLGLDVAALAGAALLLWATSTTGYHLVLAPEGVPRVSVDYWAFAVPALLWTGAGLATWRLAELALRYGRGALGRLLRPLAGPLSGTVAASLSRQRRPIATAIALLTVAVAFAASTATFNATYAHQAEVDARLTNGADVTVTPVPGKNVDLTATLSGVPGVRHMETLEHRFAYVGADLQDLYGVQPTTVTHLSDSYVTGGTAAQLMATLAARPDSILVSAETVADFQLTVGDLIQLRLTDTRTGQQVTVPFHYVGVVREFPTAPTDSFLVANSAYLDQVTGGGTPGAYLLDTTGSDPAAVAGAVRAVLGGDGKVSDITAARGTVGSSLTSVNLTGLTRIELAFALVLAAAAGGLVLALGLAERRRSFTIATALGATRAHLIGFIAGEAVVITLPALVLGALLGWGVSQTLVTVLAGVFDPPPDQLSVPWPYLAALAAATLLAITATVVGLTAATRRVDLTLIRHTD
ncbi:hypothetical protein Lfu02_78010 [Longispora fulva]|uniref:Putative ABC transport system permease protein n=1 Tax=Longispora fulva TaxID=619741 RepID=A0A8J7KW87_9ACTN|nr:FtsX-like permease family protein [Longispora fulva]MBG6136247.1 putative ABC transport system permease protein [Longispora fulva]GIG63429.1 hypothetical protein Lfu02_78010 [Longispora fulva]